jgi:hypothetical protein
MTTTMNLLEKLRSKWLLAILSAFLVYHLTVMIVLANGGSFLARILTPYLIPYANLIQLNTTWNFFAPDPAHTMFIKYKVEFTDADGNDLKEPLVGYIPPEKKHIVVDSSKRRFLYAMRFLILDTNRMQTILGPWLCREHPGATRVSMENRLVTISNLDQALLDSTVIDSQTAAETTMMNFSYDCDARKRDEVLDENH